MEISGRLHVEPCRADKIVFFCFDEPPAGQEKNADLGRTGTVASDREAKKSIQNSAASQADRAAGF